MNRFQIMFRKNIRWKIPQVVGDHRIRFGVNRRRQDMSVVGIRQMRDRNKIFVAAHEAVHDSGIHQCACPLHLLARQVRAILENIFDPLFVDRIGPTRSKKIRGCELNEQVSHRGGVEYAGVVDDGVCGQSIAHVEFLRLLRQFIECRIRCVILPLLEVLQVGKLNSAVCPNLPMLHFSSFQKADNVGT